jgi:Na+/H+-dicarboxylate symporter
MGRFSAIIVVLALAAGIIAGTLVGNAGSPELTGLAETVESVGVLWLNLLKMTVIPLVFCLLVNGIASVADAAATGRLAARSIFVFAVLLVSATVYACFAIPAALSLWPVDPAAGQALINGATSNPVQPAAPPTLGEWLARLAPANPVQAAAETAVLPLTVFAVFFGFAATRLPAAQREPMVGFFKSVADTLIVIVRWVLIAAPIGVFALSLGVGLRSGVGVAGVLFQYVAIASGVTLVIVAMAFLFAVFWGRMGPLKFLTGSAPVFATAISTQSSLATLPLMVERARDEMGVPARVANLTLPLAVAIFRMTSPVTNLAVAFFVAAAHGIELGPAQIIAGALVAIPISIGSVGLPGQVSFVASVAPICAAMGLPIDILGILLAIEVIPDIFRTLGNVAGDMAATVIAQRGKGGAATPEAEPAGAQP